ncbi:MAG: hypothetical protein HW394_1410 [Acidobacteria bacterium]|nr:hypothetical protein [Acidobacteriota bacterium]
MTRHCRHALDGEAWVGRAVAAIAIAGVAALLVPDTFLGVSLQGARAPLQSRETDSQAVAEFQKRVQQYVALHKKVEDGFKALPTRATPDQIDVALEQLSQGISTARAGAKVGDVFEPAMQVWVRRTLERVFSAPDGKQLRASILDENPIDASVRVNGPYPDAIPLSTMPPKVLEALPKLPDELEFRFVGDRLILFDHHAHIIVDYVDRALPLV